MGYENLEKPKRLLGESCSLYFRRWGVPPIVSGVAARVDDFTPAAWQEVF